MNNLLVFNHHSLPFCSIEDAERGVIDFLKICLKAQNLGKSIILVDEDIDRTWFRVELAENYFWQDWYNKKGQDREDLRAFRSISTRQPLFDQKDQMEGLDLFEVLMPNFDKELIALKAAVWNESPLISFYTRSPWKESPFKVIKKELNEYGAIISQGFELWNLCTIKILQEYAQLIRIQQSGAITSGKTLFKNLGSLFPELIFCGKANEQLMSWSCSGSLLDQVKESLTALNEFTSLWKQGYFHEYSHDNLRSSGLNHLVSNESESIRTNPKLRSHREFWIPTGRKIFFESHIKISQGYRVYFYPDYHTRSTYVGYIGVHPPLK